MKITCGGVGVKDTKGAQTRVLTRLRSWRDPSAALRNTPKKAGKKRRVVSVGLTDWVQLGGFGGSERGAQESPRSRVPEWQLRHQRNPKTKTEICASDP